MANTVTASVNVSCAAINVSFARQKGMKGMRRKRGEERESLSVNVFHLMSLLLMFFVCVRKKHLHLKRGRVLEERVGISGEGGCKGVGGVAGYMVSAQRFSLNDFYCSFVVNLLCN